MRAGVFGSCQRTSRPSPATTPTPCHCIPSSRSSARSAVARSAAFRSALADYPRIVTAIRAVRLTADEASCAAALELDTIDGVGLLRQQFHSVPGRIRWIRARCWTAHGGRADRRQLRSGRRRRRLRPAAGPLAIY